jgi:hypothetical protein
VNSINLKLLQYGFSYKKLNAVQMLAQPNNCCSAIHDKCGETPLQNSAFDFQQPNLCSLDVQ